MTDADCSTVMDVADRVQMTFESTDVERRRQHGDRVKTAERVSREYGGCRESTGYGHCGHCTVVQVRTSAMFRQI